MAEKPLTDWNSDLWDCFDDARTFCFGYWCSSCLARRISTNFGEHRCLHCFDKGNYCGCGSPAALSMRVAMRHRYGIKGTLCNDILISWCCTTLSWCQMYREMKHRKKNPDVINAQSPTAVNMQPVPMMMMVIPPPVNYSNQTVVVQASS